MKAKVERLIEARGLNPTRLARLAAVPQSSLHEMIRGERKFTLEAAAAVARALGTTLDYLCDDEAAEPPEPLGEAARYAVDLIRVHGLSKDEVIRRLSPPAPAERSPQYLKSVGFAGGEIPVPERKPANHNSGDGPGRKG